MAFEIVADDRYSEMFRVRLSDGRLTDMVNHTRAADLAHQLSKRAKERQDGGSAAA